MNIKKLATTCLILFVAASALAQDGPQSREACFVKVCGPRAKTSACADTYIKLRITLNIKTGVNINISRILTATSQPLVNAAATCSRGNSVG